MKASFQYPLYEIMPCYVYELYVQLVLYRLGQTAQDRMISSSNLDRSTTSYYLIAPSLYAGSTAFCEKPLNTWMKESGKLCLSSTRD
jgi:hypothetical protein